MKKCVLLFSGGFDSSIALNLLLSEGYEVYPLYIDYNHRAKKNEIKAVTFFCDKNKLPKLKIVGINEYATFKNHPLLDNKCDVIKNQNSTFSENYLPFRNLLFIIIASIYCSELKLNTIALGFTKKESYTKFPDTSPDFLNQLNSILMLIEPESNYHIISPTILYKKSELLKIAIERNIQIDKSYSCYFEEKCGICESCMEVNYAYNELQIPLNNLK